MTTETWQLKKHKYPNLPDPARRHRERMFTVLTLLDVRELDRRKRKMELTTKERSNGVS